jgi:energy-coupling factor transporter transmembrane protein EcfT
MCFSVIFRYHGFFLGGVVFVVVAVVFVVVRAVLKTETRSQIFLIGSVFCCCLVFFFKVKFIYKLYGIPFSFRDNRLR